MCLGRLLWPIIAFVLALPTMTTATATAETTLPPFAFIKYCIASPDDCANSEITAITPRMVKQLRIVNDRVNRTMRYMPDPKGTDIWQDDGIEGDCEDYALAKRRQLIRLGWPPNLLRIAIGRTLDGIGHAVLVAKVGGLDLVLDSINPAIKPFSDVNVRWISIQSDFDTKIWSKLGPGASSA